jgi:hypothetical protein
MNDVDVMILKSDMVDVMQRLNRLEKVGEKEKVKEERKRKGISLDHISCGISGENGMIMTKEGPTYCLYRFECNTIKQQASCFPCADCSSFKSEKSFEELFPSLKSSGINRDRLLFNGIFPDSELINCFEVFKDNDVQKHCRDVQIIRQVINTVLSCSSNESPERCVASDCVNCRLADRLFKELGI